MADSTCYVYAIAAPGAKCVKIGRSQDVPARLRSLRVGSPVALAVQGHWIGDAAVERLLHERFAARRLHGEWFDFSDSTDPVALVSSVLCSEPLPTIDVPYPRAASTTEHVRARTERPLRPSELAEALTRLREVTPARGTRAVAEAVNASYAPTRPLTQVAVSRYETGRLVPPDEHLEPLLAYFEAPPATCEHLRALAEQARREQRRVVKRRISSPRNAREFYVYETEAQRIRSFTVTMAPGLLQTEDYARAVVGGELDDARRERWLEQRARRRALVEEGSRDLEFVTTVAALSLNRGGASVMASQIARLVELSRLAHLRFGVIPASTDIGSATVLNNIDLYERAGGHRRVVIGTSNAVELVSDPDDVALHVALLDRLAGLALWGNEARAVLEEIEERYR